MRWRGSTACSKQWHTVSAIALAVIAAGWLAGRVAAEPQPPQPAPPAAKEPAAAEKTDKLIRQLGDKDYYVRQRAQDELARLGFEAFEALTAATTDPDPEIASRAKYLLRLMRMEWTSENDPPEVKRYLRDYESLDARVRQARMQVLAGLPKGQGTAALCRLVRFEKSSLLSKLAAVALLLQDRDSSPDAATVETIRKALHGCKRPGAAWLLCWTRLGAEPEAVTAQWSKLVDAERAVLGRTPEESSPEIVTGLTRCQVAWLKKLGHTDEALAAIRRLVELERGNPETLAELLDWLIEQKAWKAVDDLAARFPGRFAAEPGLLYMLAEAYAQQGKKDRAEETASRALRLIPGKQEGPLLHHLRAAEQLQNRGQFAWARREFEHVIAQGGTDPSEFTVRAWRMLAAMLHEQGQDLDAAATLEKLLRAIDAGKVSEAELSGSKPKDVRSLAYYYSACHWQARNDAAHEREYLDKALEANAEDIDVLIACYRLPAQTPEYHAKIVDAVKKAAVALHEAIADDPENPEAFNNCAWLIGNTEGDFDEALRYAQKSLELEPEKAGFYDTLAHVYAGKGDLENAVKCQAKAAKLEPHSGLIRRALDDFRKKLEEKKKSEAATGRRD